MIPGLSSVSYVADPQRWYFLLQIPGLWRVMFLVNEDASDERVQTEEFAQSLMAGVVPGITNYEIAHTTLYKVHQRVAKTFRLGRAFLVGDAAHINNPLGGMGMNGGIHDAVNLAERLAAVWHGRAGEAELDRFDQQRRLVTLEYIQNAHDPEQEEPGVLRRRVRPEPARHRRGPGAHPRLSFARLDDREPRACAGIGLMDQRGSSRPAVLPRSLFAVFCCVTLAA